MTQIGAFIPLLYPGLKFTTSPRVTIEISSSRIQILATGVFGVSPGLAWPLAPFLHKGVGHVVVNVVFIVFLGAAVERHWPWKRYLVFLVVAGYVSIAVGAAVKLAFADDPVAFLGASGILFALAGYAFVHHLTWSHTQMSRVEWFASFFGALLLLVVLADIVAGPYVDPDWFNGGHAGGFVVGALAGRFGWSRCGLRYYDPG